MLILDAREAKFLAYGVLLLCRELRHNGLPVPATLAALRDQVQEAAQGGSEWSPVDVVPVAAEPVAVDVREAARRLSISERSVRQMVVDGRLRRVRVGRRVLIPVAAISRLVDGDEAA